METKYKESYLCGHCRTMSVTVRKEWRNVCDKLKRLYSVYECLKCERELILWRDMWEGIVMFGR